MICMCQQPKMVGIPIYVSCLYLSVFIKCICIIIILYIERLPFISFARNSVK